MAAAARHRVAALAVWRSWRNRGARGAWRNGGVSIMKSGIEKHQRKRHQRGMAYRIISNISVK